MADLRHRFPSVTEGAHAAWARFDGPAGTQVVDAAIQASADWQRSGNNANGHGVFAAAKACDELVETVKGTLGELLDADPYGFVIGPSTTSNVFSVTRAIAKNLEPGHEIVCTSLDHDSNVSPWLQIAADTGATVRFADFDPTTGRLDTGAVSELLGPRTKWVAITGASNAIGTMPHITAITEAAHGVGAKVVIDGVHLTPHAPVSIRDIGCDVYSTSSYKWYGPHAGVTWIEQNLLDSLDVYKVRPAPSTGPERLQLGTPAYEQLAAIDAAARFLLDVGMESIVEHETGRFERMLNGLLADDRVTVYGPHDLAHRAPTLAFNVAGYTAGETAHHLADRQIAVWDGHYYALEAMQTLGIEGAVRAGIAVYLTDDDVDRLLTAVAELPQR